MKKRRKNLHAVALGRLSDSVRGEAKRRANRESGPKGGLVKSRKNNNLPPASMRGVRAPSRKRPSKS